MQSVCKELAEKLALQYLAVYNWSQKNEFSKEHINLIIVQLLYNKISEGDLIHSINYGMKYKIKNI